ncbi:GxxExxY protein [Candidatus Falkowbacteria bacterium]|nr:GxxExxY protein [Candidatus Falkowbacteria bacterium]
MNKVIYPELSYQVTGLLFKVHNELGRYRNEKQYADCLEEVLKENKIFYKREKALKRSFTGEKNNRNIPDFIIEDKIIIDAKAKRLITKDDYFQMKRYLVSCGKKLGIIVNFRQKYLTPRRVINSEIKNL